MTIERQVPDLVARTKAFAGEATQLLAIFVSITKKAKEKKLRG